MDFERSLNSAVKKLRAALSDSPDSPVYIETIPRVGYRFIAPVTRLVTEPGTPEPVKVALVSEPPARATNSARLRGPLAAAAVIALVGGILWFRLGGTHGPALAETDRVIVADLVNATRDPAFDSALGQALRVKLSESPYLNIVADADVWRSEALASSRAALGISGDMARRACRDLAARAVIEGAISQSGGGYEVSLTASRCAGGALIVRARERAATREDVLTALNRVTRDLRIRLGEPQTSVIRFDTPVGQATSSSLAALKAFSIGEEKRAQGKDYETIPDFKLAVDLDPDFALAYARLGAIYQDAQEFVQSRENYERAFTAREHASERERLYITAHYYGSTNEIDKSVQVYELWREIYPRDVVAPNNLASMYIRMGRTEKALAEAREAVRLGPDNAFCLLNLFQALQRNGKYPEAKSVYQTVVARHLDGLNLHLVRFYLAFGEGDQAEMNAQRDWAKGNPREGELFDAAGWAAAAGGQIAQAHSLFEKASRQGLQNGLKEYAALVLLDDAQVQADVGFAKQAASDVDAALRLDSDSAMVEANSALSLARIGAVSRARALAARASKAEPTDTILQNAILATVQALAALEEKDPSTALRHLETVKPYDLGTDANLITIFYRGQALLQSGRCTEATAEFRRLLAARLVNPNSPYLALALAGLAEADAKGGDAAGARKEFEMFFADWKGADSDLPVLRAARTEYAHLLAGD